MNIENEAVNAITSIYLENKTLPSFIINDHPYYGFKDKEAIEKILRIKRFSS